VRAHYLAYPWSLALLGAAFAAGSRQTAGQVGALLVVGAAFHIYSCVLNDVVDLDIDRSQVRRRSDPLVRGTVSPTAAHVFALIQLRSSCWRRRHLPRFVPLLLMAARAVDGAYSGGANLPDSPATDALGHRLGHPGVSASIAGAPTAVSWVVGVRRLLHVRGIHGATIWPTTSPANGA
jgi:hypothetical protein